MAQVSGNQTDLVNNINVMLSAIGESPVASIANNNTDPKTVQIAIDVLEEVNKDVQSKGWWFNESSGAITLYPIGTSTNWNAAVPEELRRYVTIRASRILHARFIGDEAQQKFTYQEELVSFGILQQAHVSHSGSPETFDKYPAELKDIGIDTFIFLGSTMEDKLNAMAVGEKVANIDKIKAEKDLTDEQKELVQYQQFTELNQAQLVGQQKLTEVQETLKRAAESALVSAQEAKTIADTSATLTQEDLTAKKALTEVANKLLVDAQKAKLVAEELNVDASTALITAQTATEASNKLRLDAEAVLAAANATKVNKDADVAIEQKNLLAKQVLTEEAQKLLVDAQKLNVIADTTLKTAQATLTQAQATDVAADTTLKGKQGALVDAQELKTDAETNLITAQETKTGAEKLLVDAQELKTDQETALITQQRSTEVEVTNKTTQEATLITKQGALVDAQELKTDAETTLVTAQELQVDAQTLTEGARKLDVEADTILKGKQGALVDAQELKTDAETTLTNKQGLLVDAQELKTDAEAALIASQTTTDASQRALIDAQELKTDAETTLTTKQGLLVDAQELKTDAETTLTTKQGALVDAQELKTDAETTLTSKQGLLVDAQELKTDSEKALLDAQKTQVDTQTALELTEEKSYADAITGVASGTTYQDFASELRMMSVTEGDFYKLPAYKKKEALKDSQKLRTATATETGTDATEIEVVNNIRRLIGEAPITALNDDAMASEAVRLLRKTDTELQGRGWWFNTEYGIEGQASSGIIQVGTDWLSEEVEGKNVTRKLNGGNIRLFDLDKRTFDGFRDNDKLTILYKRDLNTCPSKYKEWLEVRVAMLLSQLYPTAQSDLSRLMAQELEIETFFKDRQNDEGDYNIFDNQDTLNRVGINRNFSIL